MKSDRQIAAVDITHLKIAGIGATQQICNYLDRCGLIATQISYDVGLYLECFYSFLNLLNTQSVQLVVSDCLWVDDTISKLLVTMPGLYRQTYIRLDSSKSPARRIFSFKHLSLQEKFDT